MKYAVVKLQGKQYRVSEGDEVLVDKISSSEFKPEVLLYVSDDKTRVGKPNLDDVKVSLKIVNAEEKGEKIRIFKYKAKSRYRKRMGFRARYTRLLVEKIS